MDEAFDPECYFVTFRTYGSWLHGDPRGSVAQPRNMPGAARIPHVPAWEHRERQKLRRASVVLSDAQRSVVADTIRAKAHERSWRMEALAVRTNHVHAVVTAGARGESVLHDLKAFPTRALREAALLGVKEPVWSAGGSVSTCPDPESIARAIHYVLHEQ